MYDVAVTHSPRYLIDMHLDPSKSIFAKIGIDYDQIRNSDKPFDPFRVYYTEDKKSSKVLWWASESDDDVSPPVFRLWSDLSKKEKNEIRNISFLKFPEVLMNGGPTKYRGLTLWLAAKRSVVVSSLRDLFTAGGKVDDDVFSTGEEIPAVIYRLTYFLKEYADKDVKLDLDLLGNFNYIEWIAAVEAGLDSYSSEDLSLSFRRRLQKLAMKSFFKNGV